MLKQLPRNFRIIYLILYLFSAIQVLRIGTIFYPDSYAFLDMAINRSPIYSIFLKCFTSIFGEGFEIPVLITQYLIMVFAIHFFLKTLYEILKIHTYSILLLQLVLLANSIVWYTSINRILSESLAFPLVLILLVYLLKIVVEKSFPSLWKAIVVLFFLQFTRGQFIAFIPITILVICYIIYSKKAFKKGIIAIVIVALLPMFIGFSERVYNKVTINQYNNYAMTYVHLITAPFYLSNGEDSSVFETKEEKDFFTRTYSQLEKKQLLKKYAKVNNTGDFRFYQKNFSKICNATIHEANMDFYNTQGFINQYAQQYKVDELTTKMFFPLLKANFKSWLKLVYVGFVTGFGGFVSFAITILLLLLSVLFFVKDNRFIFFTVSILLKLANALIIAVAVHSVERYTFYFDWFIFAAIILLTDPFFKKHHANAS